MDSDKNHQFGMFYSRRLSLFLYLFFIFSSQCWPILIEQVFIAKMIKTKFIQNNIFFSRYYSILLPHSSQTCVQSRSINIYFGVQAKRFFSTIITSLSLCSLCDLNHSPDTKRSLFWFRTNFFLSIPQKKCSASLFVSFIWFRSRQLIRVYLVMNFVDEWFSLKTIVFHSFFFFVFLITNVSLFKRVCLISYTFHAYTNDWTIR